MLNTTSTVSDQIRAYLASNMLFSEGAFDYGDDASFLEHGIVDSLGVMELLAFVEEAFGIAVADIELTPENFDSVARLTTFVERKLAQ